MANLDWEITSITTGARSRFHVEGINHCTTDAGFIHFCWGVDRVADPRYFASPKLVISDKVQALLDLVGQIGSGK